MLHKGVMKITTESVHKNHNQEENINRKTQHCIISTSSQAGC